MHKVTLLQYRLFHYRVGLFERMRDLAHRRGINLNVVYGQGFGTERLKRDEGELSWGRRVTNLYIPIKEKKDLCWQPVPRDLKDSDLIVLMQENRLLSNYFWMVRSHFGEQKVAYWGHGRDFQSNAPGGWRERWKQWLIRQVDWWFAYTPISVQVVVDAGFPSERVTCLNNAIDTDGLRQDKERVTAQMEAQIRHGLDLKAGAPLALFCGSLYPDKRLDLLIAAADRLHGVCPDFRLAILGDGQLASYVAQACSARPWANWVGAKRGVDKAAYFRLAKFVLNPGLVGLHVLDAFAVGLPMLTTVEAKHSPEIAYLEDGKNGLITVGTAEAIAEAGLALIRDAHLYSAMAGCALETGRTYTLGGMAQNFVDGIERCLAAPKAATRAVR